MKKLFFLLFLLPSMGMVNPGSFNLAAITKALSDGNADALGQYFDNTVEVAVMDNEEVYSKAEAIRIVKNFFSKNQPSSFSQVHHGASKGQDSQYCIGNLVASSGTFRVYVYMKVSGGKYLIQELRFDKE
jgi:uncharacterized protein DUF4783